MSKLQVTTEDLHAAAGTLSGNVGATLADMASSASAINVYASGFATAGALEQFSQGWATALTSLSHACGKLASGLRSGAANYQQAESTVSGGAQSMSCQLPPRFSGR
ncbi:MAG: hypothetical protein ACYC1D_11770 [Acidimicrobiales bacterium]